MLKLVTVLIIINLLHNLHFESIIAYLFKFFHFPLPHCSPLSLCLLFLRPSLCCGYLGCSPLQPTSLWFIQVTGIEGCLKMQLKSIKQVQI